MYIPEFAYSVPATKSQALSLRRELGDEAAIYAGGTELLLAMKMGMLQYETLIDIKRIQEFSGITLDNESIAIGATSTHREIQLHPLVRSNIPELSRVISNIGNIRVRSFGTIGGNLAFAEPHADPPALLSALDASITLETIDQSRNMPVDEFLLGAFESAIGVTEIVTCVSVPVPSEKTRVRYQRFKTGERPLVTVAVAAPVEDGRFARPPAVVIGAADEIPRRVPTDGLPAVGIDDFEVIDEVAAEARNVLEPIDEPSASADYKCHIAHVLTRRALLSLSDQQERTVNG